MGPLVRALNRVTRGLFSLTVNLLVLAVLLALLAGAAWGAWQVMPEASRQILSGPAHLVQSARDAAARSPGNPLGGIVTALQRWVAQKRDLIDEVTAANGSSEGIEPLPEWISTDRTHVFGATETLWQSRRAHLSGATWSRVVFSWNDIQPRSQRDWRAGYYLRDDLIARERRNGIELVGLLMNTPPWAQARPQDGVHSVPAGLDRAVDDPQNGWASFVRKMAGDYRGRVDTWIIWNEPDIRPEGANAQYYTWAGDDRQYARLLKVAYQAAHQANPRARVLFASTTYWADASAGQSLFLERVLAILAEDPQARANHFYMDAVGLNLYSSPDDLRRVASVYRDVLGRYQLDAPLWITETNATPYDDSERGLRRDPNGIRVTMDQQASFVIQAYALGLSAGYERIALHSMTDRDTADELWGLIRNDGTLRPAFVAYQTASHYLAGSTRAVFAGIERPVWRWPPGGYVPNWQVYLVGLDRPAQAGGPVQRVSVLWNGDPAPVTVSITRRGTQATLLDKYGRRLPLEPVGDTWRITLAPATAHSPLDPDGYYYIGGDPVLLVEDGVPADAAVTPPAVQPA